MPTSIEKRPSGSTYRRRYRAFLLRCWVEEAATPEGEGAWRFSLVTLDHKHKKRGFADLEMLVAYLRAELAYQGVSSCR